MKNTSYTMILSQGLIALLVACSSTTPSTPTAVIQRQPDSASPETNAPPPSPTVTPTGTATPFPTRTPTELPSVTPSEEATFTPTATSTLTQAQGAASGSGIVVYFVLPGSGPEDCGSLVPLGTGLAPTGNLEQDVETALDWLFSTNSQYVGDLYNPSYQSSLQVSKVEFNKSSATITINLSGSFTKPKDNCGKSLYRAQVWDTVRQFPEIWRAVIWFKQYLLGDLLELTN